ncbi:alpha/beta hydrolase [Nocardia crassostreae]|uniref:alpha/beta hydrolase n=1 Tax=Nocardia crassostreae TaxID=53428 RepID=UPI000836B97F|nr:alpha/beta hydrolase [Nocardia crassostreae]
MRHRTRLAAVTAAVALLLTGCSNAEQPADRSGKNAPDGAEATPLAGLAEYQGQQIDWQPCPERPDAECGTLRVPIDYADPGAAAIKMPLVRLAATNPAARLGVLTTNPGGPGESGFDSVLLLENDDPGLGRLRERYDLIGWDPRGVGRTAGIKCLSDAEMDAYLATDFTPTDEAGRQRVAQAHKNYGEGCQRNAGKLLGFVGTEVLPHDMDVMRAALGDDKLNYIGFSYGTRVGQYYADRSPDRVGRMVVDSVDDPGENDGLSDEPSEDTGLEPEPQELTQDELSVRTILSSCAAEPSCPVGTDPEAAMAQLQQLVQRVDANPITLPDGRVLGSNMALTGAFQATYDTADWTVFDHALADALAGNGAELAALADAYTHRNASGEFDTASYAFSAVSCLNGDPAKYRSKSDEQLLSGLERDAKQAQASSPLFGVNGVYKGALCEFWPVPPSAKATALKATGAPTILLVNNTGDAATTLAAAENVAANLSDAVLVVNERDDHIAFGKGSPCVDDAILGYLNDGKVPARGTHCTA